eukprot:6412544-Alexandrium_andersonii.AAC.1
MKSPMLQFRSGGLRRALAAAAPTVMREEVQGRRSSPPTRSARNCRRAKMVKGGKTEPHRAAM